MFGSELASLFRSVLSEKSKGSIDDALDIVWTPQMPTLNADGRLYYTDKNGNTTDPVPTKDIPIGTALLFTWPTIVVIGGAKKQGDLKVLLHLPSEYRVFSAVCTHLGCIVSWKDSEQWFECPCHQSYFDKDGKVMTPPATEPLERYNVEVVEIAVDDKVVEGFKITE